VTFIVATGIEARLVSLPALALLPAVVGIMLCVFSVKLFRRRRNSQPRASQIGKAAAGIVELHGLAQGESTITSAITAQPCYYYRAVAWQQGPGRSRSWHKVAEEIGLVPFWLDDMTGRVEVNPYGADMELLRDFHEEYGPATLQTHTDLPREVTAFLARHNVATDKVVRIEEYRIPPQSPLFICGRLTQKDEAAPRQRPITAPLQAAPPPQPEVVFLSAAPVTESATAMSMQSRLAAALYRAGVQNPAAWEVASPVSTIHAYKQEAKPDPVFVIGNGEDTPLTISWHGRQPSTRGIAWSASTFVLGSLLLLASFYLLLARGAH
jgi:hypothetical protein